MIKRIFAELPTSILNAIMQMIYTKSCLFREVPKKFLKRQDLNLCNLLMKKKKKYMKGILNWHS